MSSLKDEAANSYHHIVCILHNSFEVPAVPRCDSGRRGRIWRRGRWIRWLKRSHMPLPISYRGTSTSVGATVTFGLCAGEEPKWPFCNLCSWFCTRNSIRAFRRTFQRSALKNRSIKRSYECFFSFFVFFRIRFSFGLARWCKMYPFK